MSVNTNVQSLESIVLPDFKPQGVEFAYKLLEREMQKGSEAKILVYYDPDIDGLMSGLLVEQYLERIGYKNKYYKYHLNKDRAHGFKLTDEELSQIEGYTIIAVDFSVEKEDFDRILKAGVNLIVIDHHEIDTLKYTKKTVEYVASQYNKKDTYGVILNNQYYSEPENFKFLSGAGMVYYFLKYVESIIQVPVHTDAPAMVGISLLSDVRVIESKEARSFLKYTYSSDSEFMKFLHWVVSSETMSAQRFTPFGVPRMSRDFIDYTFSPVFNALLRANKGEEALNLLRRDQKTIEEMRRYNSILSFRDVQKKIISEITKEFKESENTPGTFSNKFSRTMVCCLTNDFKSSVDCNITNYIGVACMKIKDDDKTGVILVIDKDTHRVIRGSVRGGLDGVNYLEIFQKNGVPSAGHHNAFGILECDVRKIDFEKIDKEIVEKEDEFLRTQKNTRSVLEINNLDFLVNGPGGKQICKYNELSRDNHRIYVKVLGNFEELEDNPRVRPQKISDKYIKYFIDNVCVHCYDPSLDIRDSLIVLGLENNRYIKCTMRPGFEYDAKADRAEILRKLSSL